MRKPPFIVYTVFLILLSFGLMACGSTYAKVTGVMAGIGTEEMHALEYGNALRDKDTVAENDYLLEIGEDYLLAVTYTASGGSIFPMISPDAITLKYDAEALQITPPEETSGDDGYYEVVYYRLTCIKAAVNTAVIVEADGEYTCTVIVSTK